MNGIPVKKTSNISISEKNRLYFILCFISKHQVQAYVSSLVYFLNFFFVQGRLAAI
jgi:hypothetical protein